MQGAWNYDHFLFQMNTRVVSFYTRSEVVLFCNGCLLTKIVYLEGGKSVE